VQQVKYVGFPLLIAAQISITFGQKSNSNKTLLQKNG
jgi:hypothetical protein